MDFFGGKRVALRGLERFFPLKYIFSLHFNVQLETSVPQGLLSRACHLTKALSVTQCHFSVVTLSRKKGLLLLLCRDNISSTMGHTLQYTMQYIMLDPTISIYVGSHNLSIWQKFSFRRFFHVIGSKNKPINSRAVCNISQPDFILTLPIITSPRTVD